MQRERHLDASRLLPRQHAVHVDAHRLARPQNDARAEVLDGKGRSRRARERVGPLRLRHQHFELHIELAQQLAEIGRLSRLLRGRRRLLLARTNGERAIEVRHARVIGDQRGLRAHRHLAELAPTAHREVEQRRQLRRDARDFAAIWREQARALQLLTPRPPEIEFRDLELAFALRREDVRDLPGDQATEQRRRERDDREQHDERDAEDQRPAAPTDRGSRLRIHGL